MSNWGRAHRPRVNLQVSKTALAINFLIVAAIIIGMVLWAVFSEGAEIFFTVLGTIDYRWIGVALLLMAAYLAAEVVSLKIACRIAHQKLTWRQLISISLVGQFYGVITPMATGAQPAQLYYFTRMKASVGKSAFTLLAKFVSFQVVLTVVAAVFLWLRWDFFTSHYGNLMWIAVPAFLVHVVVVMGLLLITVSATVSRKIAFGLIKVYAMIRRKVDEAALRDSARAQINSFSTSARRLSRDIGGLSAMALVTFVQLLAFYLIPAAVLKAFGGHLLDIVTMLAAASVVTMLQTAMPTPAGAGAAEGGFAAFFALFVPNGSTVVAALLVWRAVTMLVPVLLGMPALFIVELQAARADRQELRRLQKAAMDADAN